jgi:hypothetical protein
MIRSRRRRRTSPPCGCRRPTHPTAAARTSAPRETRWLFLSSPLSSYRSCSPDCKRKSVNLVWANREAECGDWEILTFSLLSFSASAAARARLAALASGPNLGGSGAAGTCGSFFFFLCASGCDFEIRPGQGGSSVSLVWPLGHLNPILRVLRRVVGGAEVSRSEVGWGRG